MSAIAFGWITCVPSPLVLRFTSDPLRSSRDVSSRKMGALQTVAVAVFAFYLSLLPLRIENILSARRGGSRAVFVRVAKNAAKCSLRAASDISAKDAIADNETQFAHPGAQSQPNLTLFWSNNESSRHVGIDRHAWARRYWGSCSRPGSREGAIRAINRFGESSLAAR